MNFGSNTNQHRILDLRASAQLGRERDSGFERQCVQSLEAGEDDAVGLRTWVLFSLAGWDWECGQSVCRSCRSWWGQTGDFEGPGEELGACPRTVGGTEEFHKTARLGQRS